MKIDLFIFNRITLHWKNAWFDALMPVISDAQLWALPLALIVLSFIIFGKKKGLLTMVLCLLAVGLSDFICGGVLQPLIGRPRPLGGVTPSFPSCHASNMVAAASVIFYFYRKWWVALVVYGIALLVAYSRVYTTSHYPSDVAGGMFFGFLFACMVVLAHAFLQKRFRKKEKT